MVTIGYKGSLQTFRIKVGASLINRWDKDEIRNFSENDAKQLLKNKNFYKASGGKPEEKEKVEKPKEEEVIEEAKEDIIEDVVEEEIVEEKVFDYKTANKDELLDFTALNMIEADYTMSNRELRVLIEEYLENID